LTAKITVLIVVVLIIGFGASTIFTIKRESDLLVEQSKDSARRLVATVVASIEAAMLQERPDITRGLIQDLKSSSPVEGLTIYRRNGVEAFTDLATLREVTKEAELSKDVVASIEKMRREPGQMMTGPLFQQAVETLRTQEALETRDGVTLFVLDQPIVNQEKCQGCHGTDHRVRAVVRIATSMEPVLAQVQQQRNRQIMIGVLTIIAAAAVLAIAMRQVVVRPIHELSRVAQRIGEGDFTARAPTSKDEVGELGTALNDMTGRLAQAQEDLAARNTELATALEHLQASRQKLELLEQLKGELSKFVPDAVKDLLERDPSATTLEKRNEEVSVLFLDIAGYTRLSEQIEPKRLNQLVQTYFSSFLEIIRAHRGDVNETAGDGLMVIFQRSNRAEPGRPDEDHALNATRAAFAIHARTVDLNEEYAGVFPAIQLHMGINTGQALLGATKLGGAGAARWTFTATGPTTNLAARFAGTAEGGEIVVGPTTAERIKTRFVLEALGERTFKNVSQPLAVYRVIPPGIYTGVRA
jgi:class 3 adenylate cyclase/HAMP domain-containing protein